MTEKAQTFTMVAMNGETFEFRRPSPLVINDVYQVSKSRYEKANVRPVAPKKLMELGPGKTVEVDDKSNPEYITELKAYESAMANYVGLDVIAYASGRIATKLTAEQLAEGSEYLDMLKEAGLGQGLTPTSAYVSRVAGFDTEQLDKMTADIMGRPFRGDGSGADKPDNGDGKPN